MCSAEFESTICDFVNEISQDLIFYRNGRCRKNHIVVFKAIKELYEKYPDSDITFVFTGEMNDYRNPQYIEELKSFLPSIENHVKILGFIDRTDQIALMKNSEFVIQPSLFEGWGTVLEDAKVLDKTVLLSDIAVHREQKSDKCVLFDPNDYSTLASVLYDESRKEHIDDIESGIKRMYENALKYSEAFEEVLDV